MGFCRRMGQSATAQRAGCRSVLVSRGQSLLEFALVMPLIMLLIFGIIEFALINASIGAYNFAAQESARFAAISGPTNANVDADMLAKVIQPRVQGIVAAQMVSVEVFKANEDGTCWGVPASFPPCPTDDFYNAQTSTWTNNWPPSTRSDQLIAGDYLGVRIVYSYTYITAFFATTVPTIVLSSESVQRIEPQEYTKRQSPRHTVYTSPALAMFARDVNVVRSPRAACYGENQHMRQGACYYG